MGDVWLSWARDSSLLCRLWICRLCLFSSAVVPQSLCPGHPLAPAMVRRIHLQIPDSVQARGWTLWQWQSLAQLLHEARITPCSAAPWGPPWHGQRTAPLLCRRDCSLPHDTSASGASGPCVASHTFTCSAHVIGTMVACPVCQKLPSSSCSWPHVTALSPAASHSCLVLALQLLCGGPQLLTLLPHLAQHWVG